jgi:hypothetical protein
VVTLAGSYPIAAVVFKDFLYVAGPSLAATLRAAAESFPLKLGLGYLDLVTGTARRELVVIVTRSPGSACHVVILSDAVPIKKVERLLSEQSTCRPPGTVRLSMKFPKSQR